MDNGPSLISSITLPPSSPSPSFSDSTPGGGSLLNGPHSYTQASEGLKVSRAKVQHHGRVKRGQSEPDWVARMSCVNQLDYNQQAVKFTHGEIVRQVVGKWEKDVRLQNKKALFTDQVCQWWSSMTIKVRSIPSGHFLHVIISRFAQITIQYQETRDQYLTFSGYLCLAHNCWLSIHSSENRTITISLAAHKLMFSEAKFIVNREKPTLRSLLRYIWT